MHKVKEHIPLKSVGNLVDANELIFNKQHRGEIDAKTADGMNTCIKGQTYLLVKLRLDYLKLFLHARIKKVELPDKMLPEIV